MHESRVEFVTSFFFTVCELCTHLDTPSFYSVFRGSFEPTALIFLPDVRCFSRGHDPITRAHRARCPARVGHIVNECCHCRCRFHPDVRNRQCTVETCCQFILQSQGHVSGETSTEWKLNGFFVSALSLSYSLICRFSDDVRVGRSVMRGFSTRPLVRRCSCWLILDSLDDHFGVYHPRCDHATML